jgi:hypothetical protein
LKDFVGLEKSTKKIRINDPFLQENQLINVIKVAHKAIALLEGKIWFNGSG